MAVIRRTYVPVSWSLCPKKGTSSASTLRVDLAKGMLVLFSLRVLGKEKRLCWLSFKVSFRLELFIPHNSHTPLDEAMTETTKPILAYFNTVVNNTL